MFEVREITQNQEWQEFLEKTSYNTFLNSLGWEKFCQELKRPTWKLGLYEDGKLVSTAIAYKTVAKRGTFLSISHSPQIFPNPESLAEESEKNNFLKKMSNYLQEWTKHLKELGKKEKCDFIRIAPIYERKDEYKKAFEASGWKKAPLHLHAEQTVVVDLTKSEKEILMGMRKTTRQMCKKGENLIASKEVEITWVEKINQEMLEVYKSTTKRGHFVGYGEKYLENEFDIFNKNEKAKMIVIINQGKILSWGMFIIANNRAFYHQGANILDKKIPSAYIMHWEGMKMAKKEGCISYDFWGVSPENAKKHPWLLISLFKRGFGGKYQEFLPAMDYPLTKKYYLTWIIETIRRFKRGF